MRFPGQAMSRLLLGIAGCLAAFAAAGASVACADTVATTGPATSVRSTSATLQGVINPSNADSAWTFQYGIGSYTKLTPVTPVGIGVRAVSVTIKDLTPATTYRFRLVVLQGSYQTQLNEGLDMTFTTTGPSSGNTGPGKATGRISLPSRRLKVRHGTVAIRLKCSGAAGAICKAKLSLTARGRLGSKVRKAGCGKGTLIASAGHIRTVRAKLSGRCVALLRAARHHRLKARLRAVLGAPQTPLPTGVTLVGTS